MLATAAAVGAALVVVPSASAQGTDTTAPVLNVGTLTPTAAPQRNGNPPAAPSTSDGQQRVVHADGADGAERHRDR